MRFTVLLLLIQICCMAALNIFGVAYDMDGFALIFIAVITLAVTLESPAVIRDKNLYIIFLVGMALRLGLLFIDYCVMPIMHSGADTEGFYTIASLDTAGAFAHGIYYRWLAVLFTVIGPARLFAQTINLLAGLASCLIMLKSFRVLGLSAKAQGVGFLLLCFLPNWADLSVILLRESLIGFFVSLSMLLFALWYKRHKISYIIAAACAAMPAIDLHSGMIFLPILLLGGLILYDTRKKKIRVNAPTVLLLCASLAVAVLLIRRYGLGYLGTLSIENIIRYSSYANTDFFGAGSTYLADLVSTTWADIFLHTPIRMFYFFFSPLPMDFRGLSDAAAFALSGIPNLLIFCYSIHALCVCRKNKLLLLFLLLALLLGGAVHAWGVSTAGAAMRHRDKLVPLYVLVLAVAVDARGDKRRYGALSPAAARALERLNINGEVTI